MMWRAIDSLIEKQVIEAARRWINTPYALGQCCPGRGVDCINLACAIQDDLRGRPAPSAVKSLRGDACLHAPDRCRAALKKILENYQPLDTFGPTEPVEPGDVIVIAPAGGGPGHALTAVGPTGIFIHTDSRRVVLTGLPLPESMSEVLHIYRYPFKAEWIRNS